MSAAIKRNVRPSVIVTFYHDVEQDFDSKADVDECRRMVRRFLALEKEYGASTTYNVVGKLFEQEPDLIDEILDAGQEVAFHSYTHRTNWSPKYYRQEIRRCREVSTMPCGYRSPRSQWNQQTLEALWENAFLWSAESEAAAKEPYFIHSGLVRLPILIDDWPLHKGIWTVDRWVRYFTMELKRRPYVAFGCHDYIASFDPEARLWAWERLLQTALKKKALLANFSESADLFRRGSVAKHYNLTAKDWNRVAKVHYRSKRFQEIIKSEAKKMSRPVVADLASGGGVQSKPLKGIAERIWCVDNSPGMVAEVESDDCIRGCLGELTETNLPDDSIDLVFCVNAVEYLFRSDDLADEIKRIGHMGGTYLVAFPAFEGSPPHVLQSPPNRIQRYFRKDEVVKWAERIGPGRVFGIQYNSKEPDGPEEEQRYRDAEKTPPPDGQPKVWISVGQICDKTLHNRRNRNIPLSVCPFRFPDQRYDRLKRVLLGAGKLLPKPIRTLVKKVLAIIEDAKHGK